MSTFDERLEINNSSKTNIIYDEHLVRYQLASQLVAGKTVLDVASGSGYGSHLLAKAGAKEVIGVDIDKAAVAEASKNYTAANLRFVVDSAEELAEIADNSVELVTSFETIEHLPNPEKYLQALHRVLTPNGLALISTPNRLVFGQKNPFHIKEFTKEEFLKILTNHFFSVELLEQRNALASFISGNRPGSPLLLANQQTAPLYFVALCAKQAGETKLSSVASLNTQALEKWQNNPGWKAVNQLYAWLVALKLIKRS